jgi:aminodeoxyfutalosine deaminase
VIAGPAAAGGLLARWIAVDGDTWLGPGEVRWNRAGRITALRAVRGPAPSLVILPGFVNAHAHLQLGSLARPPRSFLPWIDAVMQSRRATTPRQVAALARAALRSLAQSGVTAVGDIDSSGASGRLLAAVGMCGRVYRELTGFHLDQRAARALVQSIRSTGARPRGRVAAGLSPHAPYSVSAALFAAAAAGSRHLAVHCAELPAEQQFLREGDGPFRELLQRLGRLPADHRAPGVGAVRWLERLGLLRPTTQLVHCQELERGDAARIASAGAAIVVCPGTIGWFRRQPPPVPQWLAAGIPVALGTDSLASNRELSMRRELQLARSYWPSLSNQQLLAMATTHGGRALDLPVGRLRRGAMADLAVFEAAGDAAASAAAIVDGSARLAAVRIGGRPVVTSSAHEVGPGARARR